MPEFLALSIVILLFSVIVHEVMHGFMALKFGDDTAERAGRLTLNPLPHIDLFGTILLPLFLIWSSSGLLFGWAKPVPVNPLDFRDIRKGELFVSAAGILANFSLALIAAIIYHILNLSSTVPDLVLALLHFTVSINLVLGVFNLLPLPPLDGSKILMSLLPFNMAKEYNRLTPYGTIVLLILLMIPFGNSSLLQAVLSLIVGFLSSILGF